MVRPFLLARTLLPTNRPHLPQIFCRYRSLTRSIERGRQDRPSRPRARAPRGGDEVPTGQTRRERRLAQFGKETWGVDAPPKRAREEPKRAREDRPFRDRDERAASPRETPFRGRDDRPRRRDDAFERPPERMTRRGNAYEDDRPPRSDRDRYGDRDEGPRQPNAHGRGKFSRPTQRPHWEARGRKCRDRGGNPRREQDPRYEARERRPERPQRSFDRHDPRDSAKEPDAPAQASSDARRNSARGPESLPYSTAASEFIYGYSSVLAAVKAKRRKLYKLYVHSRGASRDNLHAKIWTLKLLPITREVGDEYLRAMDKASSGRPHNGLVLEASPLPVPPITELRTPSLDDASFSVVLDSQSAEDATVNGTQERYSYKSSGWRHPLILFVDGVLDEGNLGATARSAYFLGVDAIVTPTHQVAPWSHIALKASAGAAEAIPIFKVSEATDFLGKSARAGWRIYASASVPPAPSTTPDAQADTGSDIVYTIARRSTRLPADHCPVADHPTILMMGAEGTGLRSGLLNLAHYNVGIRHGREAHEVGVDSLNVSVAASLLCYKMLQRPRAKKAVSDDENALF